eukprot:10937590-Lingulodinium_polyedra.AAC.1
MTCPWRSQRLSLLRRSRGNAANTHSIVPQGQHHTASCWLYSEAPSRVVAPAVPRLGVGSEAEAQAQRLARTLLLQVVSRKRAQGRP